MDASNIIKPALSRGELQCIGATTMAEYRKFIEKDSALDRRFQPVKVDPPSVEETIQILKGIRAIVTKITTRLITPMKLSTQPQSLSDRYITGRYLPDKAIDILDEAGSRARIASLNTDLQKLRQMRDKIQEVCDSKRRRN